MKKSYLTLSMLLVLSTFTKAQKSRQTKDIKPNIVFILVDNLGYGEIGCYGGGVLRGASTKNIDQLANQGFRFQNFNTEPISTPCRAALLTGRHAIRTGALRTTPHNPYGLVQWEKTFAESLSDEGYSTALFGKWHLGNTDGRLPIDQGFDEYYGIPNTTDCIPNGEPASPYNPEKGYSKVVLEGKKGGKVHIVKTYDEEARREIDNELVDKTIDFIERNVKRKKPFYAYVPLTLVHVPTLPSRKYEGKTGNGDWADALLQTDENVGRILETIDKLKITNNTIVVFTSDNGAEYASLWNGWAGPWSGSYNTAMEGSLRTPFIIRWPGKVPKNKVSNEIVHIVDLYPTFARIIGAKVPDDRAIDGIDQSDFFLGKQLHSNRTGFPIFYWEDLFAVKYKNYKVHYIWKKFRSDKAEKLIEPRVINLYVNPQEFIAEQSTTNGIQSPRNFKPKIQIEDSIILVEAQKIVNEFNLSIQKYPLIPQFTLDPYSPENK